MGTTTLSLISWDTPGTPGKTPKCNSLGPDLAGSLWPKWLCWNQQHQLTQTSASSAQQYVFNSAVQQIKSTFTNRHSHTAVFQRQVKGTSPCHWEWAKKPQQSPKHYESFRSCLDSTALHHFDRKMSRFTCRSTAGIVQSNPSLDLHCKMGLGVLS